MVMDAPPPLPAQDMMVKPMEEIITNNTTTKAGDNNPCLKNKVQIRPEKGINSAILNCPRCNSSNTKFCYYNNYSLTQPRYFCKTCKRYWTQGGSLRNIPVGGKIRKNKTHSPNSKIKLPHQLLDHQPSSINPNYAQDLNLVNLTTSTHHLSLHHSYDDNHHHLHPKIQNTHNNTNAPNYLSAMELLTGINNNAPSRGQVMAPFMPIQHISEPNPNAVYPVGFPFQGDYRPSLSFSLDGSKAADDHQQDHGHISDQRITRDRNQHDSTDDWSGNILGGAGSW